MTVEMTSLHVDKICRTCLREGAVESIYIKSEVDCVPLAEILNILVSIEFVENDKLPSQICAQCSNEVQRFYKFKQQCQKSDETLKYYVDFIDTQETIDIVEVKCELNEEEENARTTRRKRKKSSRKCEVDIDYSSDSSWEQTTNSDQTEGKAKRRKSVPKCPSLICKRCDIKFETKEELSRHRSTIKHPRTRNHSCTICGKSFTYSQLCVHMRSHTNEKPYTCDVCAKRFTLKCNLRRHSMIHTGERPHKCHLCDKGFIQATSLHEHIRTHSGETPFVCNKCGRSYTQLRQLDIHLKRHIYEEKGEQQTFEHQCDVCLKTFSSKRILKTHQLSHGAKTYLCSNCGRGFVSMAGLQSHEKVHTGHKPYKCTVCPKTFAQLGSLKSHLLTHTGQRPFVCSVCKRSFTQSSHLMYHKRIHTGERPYSCSMCDKRFTLKGTLTVHMRTHTGETPFLCPVCNKGFYDSSSMNKHRRSHSRNTKLSK